MRQAGGLSDGMSDGLYEVNYFIKSAGPMKSVGLCWSGGLYEFDAIFLLYGPVFR